MYHGEGRNQVLSLSFGDSLGRGDTAGVGAFDRASCLRC
jgi:hypothetical protein